MRSGIRRSNRSSLTGAAALATAALAFAAGCGGSSGSGGGEDGAVKVGGMFDLSGPTADIATPYAAGIAGFVEDYNERGQEPPIEFTTEDHKYDVAVAERLYSRMKADGAVAVQGWGTGDTEALRARVTADRVPFMSASYAETLTDPAETPYNFVVGISFSDQMRVILDWIAEQEDGDAEVAFFHHDSPFGESPLEAGRERAAELGIGFEAYAMPAEATDYVSQLQRARSQGADHVVIHTTSTPAAQLLKDIDQQGLDLPAVCLNWCADELMIELAGDAAEGARGLLPFAPASAGVPGLRPPARFLASEGGSLDREGLHYVQGWYTMAVMAAGIQHAAGDGEVTGETIKGALEEMGPVKTGGVSAPIEFTPESHAGMHGARLYTVTDGRWDDPTPPLSP